MEFPVREFVAEIDEDAFHLGAETLFGENSDYILPLPVGAIPR